MANSTLHDQIALRAYERFAERGYQNGHDLDDWLWAERSLRDEAADAWSTASPASPRTAHHEHAEHNHHRHHRAEAGRTSPPPDEEWPD
jgi:hypothetical protein